MKFLIAPTKGIFCTRKIKKNLKIQIFLEKIVKIAFLAKIATLIIIKSTKRVITL